MDKFGERSHLRKMNCFNFKLNLICGFYIYRKAHISLAKQEKLSKKKWTERAQADNDR